MIYIEYGNLNLTNRSIKYFKYKSNQILLFLCELHIKKKNGLKCFQDLKNNEFHKNVVFIMVKLIYKMGVGE